MIACYGCEGLRAWSRLRASTPQSIRRPAHFPANTDSPSIDETVGEVLRQQAAATPDRPAIIEWIGSSSQLASTSYAALLDAATVAR